MSDKAGSDTMFEKIYFEAQEALDEILGPNEDDGYGQGLVGEIWLVARQRDAARKVVEAVEEWLGESFGGAALHDAYHAYVAEMAKIKAEIDA